MTGPGFVPPQSSSSIAGATPTGGHAGAIGLFADESERRRDAELLRIRTDQRAALADLGLRALGGGAVQDLLEHASASVAKMLDVEFSEVLELVDEESGLRLVAGVGWRTGTVGAAHVGLDSESQAGFALARDQPVVVEDWRAETRFGAPLLLREHGVVSGAVVVIHGRDRPWGTEPWGVVGVHTRLPRTFTAEDIAFLESVANTLALAIERGEAEQKLRQRNSEMAELAEQVARLADERRRIMADALDAEDRTREHISQLLHDEVLQSLLSARQDPPRHCEPHPPATTRSHMHTKLSLKPSASCGTPWRPCIPSRSPRVASRPPSERSPTFTRGAEGLR
jgi:GAF domain-containing protein